MGKEAGAAAGGDLKAGSPSTFALSLARGPFLLAPARLLEGWSNPWGGPQLSPGPHHSLRGAPRKLLWISFASTAPGLQKRASRAASAAL